MKNWGPDPQKMHYYSHNRRLAVRGGVLASRLVASELHVNEVLYDVDADFESQEGVQNQETVEKGTAQHLKKGRSKHPWAEREPQRQLRGPKAPTEKD